jgi:hypothetical protein
MIADKSHEPNDRGPLTRPVETDDFEFLSFGAFFAGYIIILASLLVFAWIGQNYFVLEPHRGIFGFCGVLFLVASGGRPRILHRVVRQTGWFAAIRSEQRINLVLRVLGSLCLVVAVAWNA